MLPFMREQELGELSNPKPPAGGNNPADGAARPQEQEYLTVATKSKNVRNTTCLLVVLFGIGLVSLLLMIKKSAPRTAGAGGANNVETQIETAISRLTGIKAEMFKRMDEIVKKFYEFSDVQQVKVNELAKNPFEHDMFMSNLKEIADTKDQNNETDLIRQRQLRQQAKQLELLGIMRSTQGNCCMIDDKVLYVGDSIKGFRVSQIGDNFVRIQWDRDSAPQEGGSMGPGQNPSDNVEIILKLSE
ncbi:MAG TPA: hypothetical protein VMW16_05560 [Sedimentisphaerales bacterium]|nr:hypothetical protein [Sedimentisphaerales bacterium]